MQVVTSHWKIRFNFGVSSIWHQTFFQKLVQVSIKIAVYCRHLRIFFFSYNFGLWIPNFGKKFWKKTHESSNLQGDCVGLGYLYPSVLDGNLLEQQSCGDLQQFGWRPRLAKSGTLVAGIWCWRRYFTPPRTKQGTEWNNDVPKIFFIPRLVFCMFFCSILVMFGNNWNNGIFITWI